MKIDGDFTIYVLTTRRIGSEKWISANYDYFGAPPDFNASGLCWQRLGIHGTFVRERGIEAMNYMSKKHPAYDWKLQRLKLSQHRLDIAMVSGEAAFEQVSSVAAFLVKNETDRD